MDDDCILFVLFSIFHPIFTFLSSREKLYYETCIKNDRRNSLYCK